MSKYATKQRKLLLDYLTCHTDEPLTAEQIARDLAPAAISVSAIYRNLAQLEAEGSVRRVSAEGSRKTLYRYRDEDVCADHLHLACARCGKTYHMDAAASTSLIRAVAREAGFAVDSASTVLYGVCGNCRKS
ncbi:MAG: transcriptional repressor [Oscillospiraceae bacterium]|jgi:Fur family ferric uptake transcriptional regulator|nr:transcriptional repressor [Oscillospiraceae bacterium]